jgi:hypothetical protein
MEQSWRRRWVGEARGATRRRPTHGVGDAAGEAVGQDQSVGAITPRFTGIMTATIRTHRGFFGCLRGLRSSQRLRALAPSSMSA